MWKLWVGSLGMAHNDCTDEYFVFTFMNQQTEILQLRITPDIKKYLDIIRTKYNIKRSQFIRDAIIEKLKRDVPKIRNNSQIKEKCPF